MNVDLEAIFEMEAQLKVVPIDPGQPVEQKKEMEVSAQESDKSWEAPQPLIHRIPA